MASNQSPEAAWVEIRSSNVNLALTLVAPLCAAAVLLVIELPDWIRAVLLLLLLLTTIADVYLVRHKSAHAIAAFYLFEQPVTSRLPADAAPPVTAAQPRLGIRLRYRHPGKRGGIAEAEGLVGPRSYVSTYFTSISYRLSDDPAWRRWFPRVVSLWADGIDREAFRQVRVRLKWR